MTNATRIVSMGAILIAMLVGLVFYTQRSKDPADESITLALNIWPGYGAFLIAEERKIYQAEGVDVRIEIIQGDSEREAALVASKIDGIGMTMDNLVLLRARGVGVKAIYKYDGSFGADGLVAKKSIASAADLAGKDVAWAPGTTSHFFLTQYLKGSGFSTKDLKHKAMSSDDAGSAFAAGHLDAAVTWEPWLSKAKEKSDSHVLVSTRELPVVEDVLFVREETLSGKRKQLLAMLRACFKAVAYWQEHPAEGNVIVAKRLKLPVKDVEDMLAGIQIMDLNANKKFFAGSESSPASRAFTAAAEAWLNEGLIDKSAKPDSGIDGSLIADLK